MNFLTDKPETLYRKFLSASAFSALVVSIYAFVDTIAVGQSEGPVGTAAIAVITPLYGVFTFFSLLCGIGGAVQMSRVKGEGKEEKGNAYFTASVIIMAVTIMVLWLVLLLFHNPIFRFFGADEALTVKVMEYSKWLLWFLPLFLLPSFLASFIRNDGSPALVMKAVIIGGCVNMLGDWFFVFPMQMGMSGAGLATVIGNSVQTLVMSTHFFSRRCKLKLVKPFVLRKGIVNLLKVGFGAGILELGTVMIAIMMNNQIMRYGSTVELSIYGVLITIFQLFLAMFSGVGQAIQPLVSSNFGAGNSERNLRFLHLAFMTVVVLGAVFTLAGELFPLAIIRLFIAATPEVLSVAADIVRIFFLLFAVSGISVLATYYLQSTMRYTQSLVLSLLKGVFISGLCILILPHFFGITGIWMAMPCSELIVALLSLYLLKRAK